MPTVDLSERDRWAPEHRADFFRRPQDEEPLMPCGRVLTRSRVLIYCVGKVGGIYLPDIGARREVIFVILFFTEKRTHLVEKLGQHGNGLVHRRKLAGDRYYSHIVILYYDERDRRDRHARTAAAAEKGRLGGL